MRIIYAVVLLLTINIPAWASSPVEWTRLHGIVKAMNLRAKTITIENRDRDLLVIGIDDDVKFMDGSTSVAFKDIRLDEKVILLHIPIESPDILKEETFQEMNQNKAPMGK